MPTHPRIRSCLSLLLASWSFVLPGCVGTPTPEPPDHLPRPDGDLIDSIGIRVVTTEASDLNRKVPIFGSPGAAPADSALWLVNLDAVGPAVNVQAKSDGSFSAELTSVPGQRLRIVTRSDRQHSLPLDLVVVEQGDQLAVSEAPESAHPCLTITPLAELSITLAESTLPGGAEQHAFRLDNRCTAPVVLERAALRFADPSFSLATAPASVPAEGSAQLLVEFAQHEGPGERGDILLLEVAGGGERGRYALGIWSRASSGSGKR